MHGVSSARVPASRVLLVAGLRRVPRVPRRDHRQRRVPLDPRVVPRDVDRRAVLGAQRLQHRLRGVPHRLRPAHRPGRPAPRVRRRRRRVHRRVRAVRGRARPSSCWWPPGSSRPSARRCSCRHRSPWSSRRSRTSGAPTPSACGAPRPRSRAGLGPPHRRRTGRARRLALGVLGQPAVRRWSRVWAAAQPAGREPGARVGGRCPTCVGAALLAAGLALLNLGIVKGSDWGWASAGGARLLRRAPLVLARPVRAQLAAPPLAAARPRAAAHPVLRHRVAWRRCVAGFGFYAYLLTNILWLQYVWGYDVLRAGLALVPGALVAAVVAARLGPLADRYGYRVLRRARAPWCGRAPTSGTTSRSGWSRPSGPSGCRGRCSAASGSVRPCPCWAARPSRRCRAVGTPRRPRSSRAPASWAGCSGIAVLVVDARRADAGHRGRGPSATAGCSRSSRSSLVAARRPAARQAPRISARRGRGRRDEPAGRPARPARHRGGAALPPARGAGLDRPLRTSRCSPRCRRTRVDRLERAAELVDVPAGTWLMREGDPPGLGVRRAARAGSRSVVGGRAGPRARARCRCSASWRCSPGSRGRPTCAPAVTRRSSRCLATAFEEHARDGPGRGPVRARPRWRSGCAPPASAAQAPRPPQPRGHRRRRPAPRRWRRRRWPSVLRQPARPCTTAWSAPGVVDARRAGPGRARPRPGAARRRRPRRPTAEQAVARVLPAAGGRRRPGRRRPTRRSRRGRHARARCAARARAARARPRRRTSARRGSPRPTPGS